MIVVSDTSAITSLIQVGRVELLAHLYGDIFIPEAVQMELLRTHLTLPKFIRSRGPANQSEVRRLSTELDLGEAEAIILAKEIGADYLLIDESDGRRVAIREGVRVVGGCSASLEAKERGYLGSVRESTEKRMLLAFASRGAVKRIVFREAGEDFFRRLDVVLSPTYVLPFSAVC